MLIEYQGALKTLCEISFEADVPYSTLCWRIKNGWNIDEAVTGNYIDESVRAYNRASNQEYISEVRYTTKELYDLYVKWCEKEGFTPLPTLNKFSKSMKNYGWHIFSSNGNRYFRWE